MVEFGTDQSLLSGNGFMDGAMLAPEGVALDASGHAWIADNGGNAASLLAAGGTSLLAAPFSGGGLAMPAALAVDGSGTVWVANSQTAGSVSKLAFGQSAPLSPAAGFGSLDIPAGIATDASRSIWAANAGDNSVSEIVGAVAPAITPLAASSGP